MYTFEASMPINQHALPYAVILSRSAYLCSKTVVSHKFTYFEKGIFKKIPRLYFHSKYDSSGAGYRSLSSDSLRAGRSGDRIPVWSRFSALVQTGAGAHPASYTMGTGLFYGVKRPGLGVEHPPPLAPSSVSSWPVLQ